MASTRDYTAPPILAEDAETQIPITPVAGVSYRNPDTPDDTIKKGFRYNTIVDSASIMNQFQYLLSRITRTIEQQGVLGWCDLVDYEINALVMGSDSILYQATQASGPNNGGAKDPTTSNTVWQDYAQSKIAETPTGAIITYAAETPPAGWLECNGDALSRIDYAKLFSIIGTQYGEGDGSTTFALPDLRGEFVRGWDHGRGIDSGREFGNAQGDAIRNLTGEFSTGISFIHEHYTSGVFSGGDTNCHDAENSTARNGSRFTLDASTQVPTADENRPRNIALMYCIKY